MIREHSMTSVAGGSGSARPAWLLAWLLAASAMLGASVALAASDAAEFFRGKRLTYIVPTKPGGGYDGYARLIARHLPKHLPVKTVEVRNVPGASHLIGMQQLFAAPPDGLTLGTFNSGLIYAQIDHSEGMNCDLRELSWIGKAASDARVFVVGAHTGIESLEQLRQGGRTLHFATSGKSSASNYETGMVIRLLGLDATPVHGFVGTEAELAVMRGDIDGLLGYYSALRDFVEQGHGRILFRMGAGPAELAAVPELGSLLPAPEAQRFVELVAAQAALGRLTVAPPGVPPERLAVLRDAYLRTLADPELLREAAAMKLPIEPLDGAAVQERVLRLLAHAASGP
jgi:tripartite-type tricarboxylate transporter receptor subunit TctC